VVCIYDKTNGRDCNFLDLPLCMLFSHHLPSIVSGSEVESENDVTCLTRMTQNIMYEF
jgi:hypothetical protein